jgi:putative ABC transport system substrate-binding protein
MRLASASLLLTLFASNVHAGGVTVIVDGRVAQYREALEAAREVLRNPSLVDVSAPDAAEQVHRAESGVILAVGQKALQLAKEKAPGAATVFCMVLGSAAAPSRTVTGVRLEVPASAQLQLIKQVHPGAKRLGVIYDPRTSAQVIEDAVKAAGSLGFTLVSRAVHDPREVRGALAEMADGIDALWLLPDPRLLSAEMFSYLLASTLERRIALFGFLDSFTEAGALASIAPDYAENGRRAGRLAMELAERPSETRFPVPAPLSSSGSLSINSKSAKQLGVDVPPSVLAKARHVYR